MKINGLEIKPGANLREASLREANLWGADLREANLRWANLHGANLRGADLHGANLRWANLWGADLHGANLWGANLREADLRGANLWGADLHGADLRGAKNIPETARLLTQIVPDEGSFIGWKMGGDGSLIKLEILDESPRSNATGRKCRAQMARVLSVTSPKGADLESSYTNKYGPLTQYRVGEIVEADRWDRNRWNECSHGIHFFITKQEALDW